jgi:hypothetical protein
MVSSSQPQLADRSNETERHAIAHSIVLYESGPGFNVYHPQSRELRRWSDEEIRELARRVREHAHEGNYMSLFQWPQALGVVADEHEDD